MAADDEVLFGRLIVISPTDAILGVTLLGMGVHGLATYLRENRSAIAKTLVFPTLYDETTPFVIDGWS